VAPVKPIEWEGDADAFALAGDTAWTNYSVSIDVNLQQNGTVELIGRANTQARPPNKQAGYYLRFDQTGTWSLSKNDTTGTHTSLASGTTTALGLHSWHTISLTFNGSTITAKLATTTLATVHDATYGAGQIGFGVVGYQTDQFDNLAVTTGTAGSTPVTNPGGTNLPVTGSGAAPLAGAGLVLAAAGAALYRIGRRPRIGTASNEREST